MIKTLFVSAVSISAVATLVLLCSPHFDGSQKAFQALTVWRLPVLGGLGIAVFRRGVFRNTRTRLQPHRPNGTSDDVIVTPADLD